MVFASKGPLVARYRELSELALSRGVSLGMSAAVGIPLPSLEVGVLPDPLPVPEPRSDRLLETIDRTVRFVLEGEVGPLRDLWEATSFQLERLQFVDLLVDRLEFVAVLGPEELAPRLSGDLF